MTAALPPSHPTQSQIERAPRRHHLFGFPISHSASPAFHNLILQALPSSSTHPPTYSLCETKSISEPHFKSLVRDDQLFGGSSVTMPLKVEVAKKLGPSEILDELSESALATQTVNTIVVLPPNSKSNGKKRMLGTNTDYLGIRHAILRSCALQNSLEPSSYLDGSFTYPKSPLNNKPYSAFIIGSGGTCRSAVYALSKLGFSPLYLLNRDRDETQDVIDHFKSTGSGIDLRSLRSEEEFKIEAEKRRNGELGQVVAAVGAIPAFEPQSEDEKMVYKLAHAFFDETYSALSEWNSSNLSSLSANQIPLPSSRPFLDMCYKPRLTPLLAYAAKAGKWSSIGGVEAMIEQGLSQARMWAASARILEDLEINPIQVFDSDLIEDPSLCATRAGDDGPLGNLVEKNARDMVLAMSDIVVPSTNSTTTTILNSLDNNQSKANNNGIQQAQRQPISV